MKITAKTLIAFLIFLIIPANAAFACGKHSKKQSTEKSCHDAEKESKSKPCCNKDSKHKSCDGACGKNSCKCPTSINFAAVIFEFNFQFQDYCKISEKVSVHHLDIPKPVYYSTWRPPNIS